ncbi:ABC transporter substrate-binding protein [Nocardioides mangrovi]|uniref:ABC transporter substrate-binding protein n=1 Tax=Nocardioides mangrovi TaxID=2874580 RepID=A0ABS7UBR8_9ACTN|nr:ABC transporter substrate-binding protein [Nocardioides mangrovi]MBZ5738430.1 ABC transporter substrate-binding protein [Nocardioides mangrovi]
MKNARVRGGAIVAAAGLTMAAAGCSGGAANTAKQDTDGPIRVAVVTPQSGPYAAYGEEQRKGIQFAADEANADGGIDGHKIELEFADDLGTPEGALAAAQKLVQDKQAPYVIGMVSSPEMAAVTPKLEAWDALMIGTQGQSDDLTGKACTPRYFRTTANDTVGINTIAYWLGQEDEPQWDSIAADYSFGQASTTGVENALEDEGSDLGAKLFSPLGTTDFGSYLSQLSGKGGLVVSLAGADAVNFYKQALQFGVLQKYDTVLANTGLSSTTLAALDDDRLVGALGTNNWLPTADTPETAAFVKAYTEKNGEGPTENIGNGYMGMQTIFAGIEKAGSIAPGDVADALEGLTYDSIQGEVTMRAEDHQIEAPTYVGTVERDAQGQLILKATAAIPASENNPTANPDCNLK